MIEEQTERKFVVTDFVPVPCCFPTCNSVTYAFIDGEKITPLPRIVNVDDYLDYITNRVMPDFSPEIRRALEGLWSSSSVSGSQKSAESSRSPARPAAFRRASTVGDISKFMFMIMLQDFMDPWTFNQKNLMKCCKEIPAPGGQADSVLRLQHGRLSRTGAGTVGRDGAGAPTLRAHEHTLCRSTH